MYGYNITYPLGITVIGILSGITAVFLLSGIIAYLIYFEKLWEDFCARIYMDITQSTLNIEQLQTCLEFKPVTIKLCITAIVYLTLFVACSGILIWGGMKKRKSLMFPYQVTLVVTTVLTVLLCAYIARHLPYEFKVLLGFLSVFISIISLSCYFSVSRHVNQINMAEMVLLSSKTKFEDSFMSSKGLRTVTSRGKKHAKAPLTKLPSIQEQAELTPPQTMLNRRKNGGKDIPDSLFIVDQSIQSVENQYISDTGHSPNINMSNQPSLTNYNSTKSKLDEFVTPRKEINPLTGKLRKQAGLSHTKIPSKEEHVALATKRTLDNRNGYKSEMKSIYKGVLTIEQPIQEREINSLSDTPYPIALNKPIQPPIATTNILKSTNLPNFKAAKIHQALSSSRRLRAKKRVAGATLVQGLVFDTNKL